MNRQIFYPTQLLADTDLLSMQKNAMLAIGALAQATLGTSTIVDGFALAATSPASMTVNVGSGSITSFTTVDATNYGSLASDTTDSIVKVGTTLGTTALNLSAYVPTVSGQSVNLLIEVEFSETDTAPAVLGYFNASSPSTPYSGPPVGGVSSGAAQNTVRAQLASLTVKPGTPAATGTQTTPAVDSGWTGLYVITLSYGQTTVTSSSWITYPSAPFLPKKLGAGMVPGFSNIQVLTTSGSWTVPIGITKLSIEAWGGGGGGGGSGNSSGGTAGGGAGYCEGVVTVMPGQVVSYTVGAGGAGGAASGNGSNGGATTILGFTAGYGVAGLGNGAGSGQGGVASGGSFNQAGAGGSYPLAIVSGIIGGSGGGSWCSGGVAANANSAGANGVFPGQGGNGAGGGTSSSGDGTNHAGGAGAAGQIIIRW